MGLGSVGREVANALGMEWADRIAEPVGSLPWTSRLPVATLATDSVAVASSAMNDARNARGSTTPSTVRVDRARVAASFGSERVLRVDDQPPAVWAPLSGFWRSADGWVRTHANYTHHERALLALLGLSAEAGKDAVADAILAADAVDWEDLAASSGAVVGAVRGADVWSVHPQAHAVAAQPLVEVTRFGDAPPRRWRDGSAPLSGIRVLDMTRVLAGPVAARDLALAGAQVLRVDSPHLEETGWIHLDTGQGKRSTRLDLDDTIDRRAFESLLATADVLLTGYRPGALSRFGLDAGDLAHRHPGLVTGSVSAWGTHGPWAGRRGFDSIVQAVTGIAMLESPDGVTPGALPVQALDHSAGHFLAAAVTIGLIEQRKQGGSVDVRIALARIAHALLHSPDIRTLTSTTDAVPLPSRHRELSGRPQSLTYAPPVLAFDGAPDDYPVVGGAWGVDAPAWSISGQVRPNSREAI